MCRDGYYDNQGLCIKGQCNDAVCPGNKQCISPKTATCECKDGFYMNQADSCIDIDECLGTNSCNKNASCHNIVGSYFCLCSSGFHGNGTQCFIGDCTDSLCPENGECVSSTTFDCQCKKGFEMNEAGSCVDFDECSAEMCDTNALCLNSEGSYQCDCGPGFYGNGHYCAKGQCNDDACPDNQSCISPNKLTCACTKEGYYETKSGTCTDVNECKTKNDCASIGGKCTNKPGTYECTCLEGFTGDGKECEQVISILAISDSDNRKPAVLVNSLGEEEELSCFKTDSDTLKKDSDTEASYQSCPVSWQNKMLIFGGSKEKRQISRIDDFHLTRIGTLAFDHWFGGCTIMNDELIFLCFDKNGAKICHFATDPLGFTPTVSSFTPTVSSFYKHEEAPVSASGSKLLTFLFAHFRILKQNCLILSTHFNLFLGALLAVGGVWKTTAEYYNKSAGSWTFIDDFPFAVLESNSFKLTLFFVSLNSFKIE